VGFLKNRIRSIANSEFGTELSIDDIALEHPSNKNWGDLSTNVSFIIAKMVNQSPVEIARKISYGLYNSELTFELDNSNHEIFKKIDFQEPGFVNFEFSVLFLLREALSQDISSESYRLKNNIGQFRGQKVLFEYTDPNPFKSFHIGHLMSNAIGESLSRLYEYLGAELKRVNYQGDVGLHVAKSIWGVLQLFKTEGFSLSDVENMSLEEKVAIFGKAYALGVSSYESAQGVKDEIHEINYLVYIAAQELLINEEQWAPIVDYKKHLESVKHYSYETIRDLYYKGRAWSLEDFANLYDKLGTKFNEYYFESKVGEYGFNLVQQNLSNGVFEQDNGAVIFRGQSEGLHNRVFINSKGLPTYEAKDLGLAMLKYETFKYDKSFIITANEINEYFKVVLLAMSKINPDLAAKTTHIGHGVMRFKSGKMSSRTGDIITGVGLIEDTKQAILEVMESSGSDLDDLQKDIISTDLAIGAIKYSILKQGLGKDIIFDKNSAILITGDTGPYLQYSHARANSVIEKAGSWNYDNVSVTYEVRSGSVEVSSSAKDLLRNMIKFNDIVIYSQQSQSLSILCDYLYDLAQCFNTFYNNDSILFAQGNDRNLRIQLCVSFKNLMKVGLWLLGIKSPDRV